MLRGVQRDALALMQRKGVAFVMTSAGPVAAAYLEKGTIMGPCQLKRVQAGIPVDAMDVAQEIIDVLHDPTPRPEDDLICEDSERILPDVFGVREKEEEE